MERPRELSIIVPVYRDWERLQFCLNALAQQSYPRESFEILVVQNDVMSRPSEINCPVNTVFLHEPKVGSYAARNAGLEQATGKIIGFTDSDCIPHPEWVNSAMGWFNKNPTISRLAGRINITTRDLAHRSLAEVYDLMFAFPQDVYVQQLKASATANLFARHAAFELVGRFDERYLSGGDIEWGQRAERAGLTIMYADDVVVDHPARTSHRALVQKAQRVGAGRSTHGRFEIIKAHAGILKAVVPPLRMFLRTKKFDVEVSKKLLAMALHYQLKLIKAVSRLRVAYGRKPRRS